MKWLDRQDDRFVRLAGNDDERASELARLRGRRVLYLCLGFIQIVASAALKVSGHDMGYGPVNFGVLCLCLGFKCEGDIRMLKALEELQRQK